MSGMEMPLVDLGDYPEINAYDIGEYQEIGAGLGRFVMAGWYKMDGVWRRKVTGLVTRPIVTMAPEHLAYWRAAFNGRPPSEIALQLAH